MNASPPPPASCLPFSSPWKRLSAASASEGAPRAEGPSPMFNSRLEAASLGAGASRRGGSAERRHKPL
eukprot:856085-Pyramimonas_sp.AAC.1